MDYTTGQYKEKENINKISTIYSIKKKSTRTASEKKKQST